MTGKFKKDDLGFRMKTYYEAVSQTKLLRRTPVAIRIDGKAFHTLTKGFDKPFDMRLMTAMKNTTKYLCENIQGCVLGYTQSDEITLILIDYQNLDTSAWFDYKVQKMCSVAASMATMAFNREFEKEVLSLTEDEREKYLPALETGAMFDARCFNIPKEEVTNLICWRQLDATRNSIQMLGQYYFQQEELQNKSSSDIMDMLVNQHHINWNDLSADKKRGSCCIRVKNSWIIDNNIPVFKGEEREYVEKLIMV